MQYQNEWRGCGRVTSKHRVKIDAPNQTYFVTDLNVMFKRRVKGVSKTTIIPCEAWGKYSDVCDNIEVGNWVEVVGRFENKEWRGKNHEMRNKNLIVVEGIKVL